jgi:hypothetical protein
MGRDFASDRRHGLSNTTSRQQNQSRPPSLARECFIVNMVDHPQDNDIITHPHISKVYGNALSKLTLEEFTRDG